MTWPRWVDDSTCNLPICNGDGPPDVPECPEECQSNQVVYSECGNWDECACFPNTIRGHLNAWWQGPCRVESSLECDCPTAKEYAEDGAMARAESMEDR